MIVNAVLHCPKRFAEDLRQARIAPWGTILLEEILHRKGTVEGTVFARNWPCLPRCSVGQSGAPDLQPQINRIRNFSGLSIVVRNAWEIAKIRAPVLRVNWNGRRAGLHSSSDMWKKCSSFFSPMMSDGCFGWRLVPWMQRVYPHGSF